MWARIGKAGMAVLDWAPPAKYVVPVMVITVVVLFTLAFMGI